MQRRSPRRRSKRRLCNGKFRFRSQSDASIVANRMPNETWLYPCDRCKGGWHITGEPPEELQARREGAWATTARSGH